MYRLLVLTDSQDVVKTIEQIDEWEAFGFRAPRIVSSCKDALNRLENHRVDAIGIKIGAKEKKEMLNILNNQYPYLPIISLSTKVEKQKADVEKLKQYLNRINADYSNDDCSIEDRVEMERHHFAHDLLTGKISSSTEFRNLANTTRFPVAADKPCMLIEMDTSDGGEFLAVRWHYGSERLEVALRNFIRKYIDDHHFYIAVASETSIRMLIDSFKEGEETSVMDSLMEAIESIDQYMGLKINIKSVSVVESPKILI